jgi:aspartyl-tRNA(Asn)/glutamyl-tRNA(Gln) amidotransferase subunit A
MRDNYNVSAQPIFNGAACAFLEIDFIAGPFKQGLATYFDAQRLYFFSPHFLFGRMETAPSSFPHIADLPTTNNSRLTLGEVATSDASIVARLRAAGAIFLGKAETQEFAMGGPDFSLPFGPARNPWAVDRFTGGSSSGSAAAVASGTVPLAIGTDTGGSIRTPSAYCGIAGMKPTYGRVSRRGMTPQA